ncbi:MAG: hypothetical protein R3263_04855 [Myxococcota bacterium]|nr:hypothetical protein [Myxococcota bacterium]
MKVLGTVAGIAAFVALLAWSTLGGGDGVSCEVCMSDGTRTHCATVQAPTREEAIEAGRRSACGVLTASMADELGCQRGAPARVTCTP